MGTAPRLFANDRGVWRESIPGFPSGIEWGEVYSVRGQKVDGITAVYKGVVLDFENEDFIELYDDWPRFQQVVAAITQWLTGISPDWFLRVEGLGVNDPPVRSMASRQTRGCTRPAIRITIHRVSASSPLTQMLRLGARPLGVVEVHAWQNRICY